MEASSSPGVPDEGLRAWKKARTRQSLSDVATRLFVEHGFDAVTVADVAAAAEVSVKTVFNYFATKEDLFFDRADDVFGHVADAILERPAGTTVLEALRALLADRRVPFDADGWDGLRDPQLLEGFRAFLAAEHASPALRARRVVISQGWTPRLAALLGDTLRRPPADPAIRIMAELVIALMTLRERELSDAVLRGAQPGEIERRVREVVDEGFARLAAAFADLDVPRAPG